MILTESVVFKFYRLTSFDGIVIKDYLLLRMLQAIKKNKSEYTFVDGITEFMNYYCLFT